MAEIDGSVTENLNSVSEKLSSERHLSSVQKTFFVLWPVTLTGSLAVLVSAIFRGNEAVIPVCEQIAAYTMGYLPLYVCAVLTYHLCIAEKRETVLQMILTMICFLMIWKKGSPGGVLSAILTACFIDLSYSFLKKKRFGHLELRDGLPEVLEGCLSGLLIISCFGLLHHLLKNACLSELTGRIYGLISGMTDNVFSVVLMTLFLHLIWYLGIHDSAYAGILAPIREAGLSCNAMAMIARQDLPHVFTTSFWVYFVIIGGCGSVFSLALLLCFSRSERLRKAGRTGILPALFNISEPVMFAVPVVMNPSFLIPFLSASAVNAAVSCCLMAGGMIGKSFGLYTWNMPCVLGAYLSTLDIRAALLVIFLVIIDAAIYYPFYKAYERKVLKEEGR